MSRDKANVPYLQHHNNHRHQTWEGNYMQWRASFHKVSKSLVHVVLQGHVTNLLPYNSTTTMPMTIKPNKVVSYYTGPPHIKSHSPLNIWSLEVTWQIIYVISLLPTAWSLTIKRGKWSFTHTVTKPLTRGLNALKFYLHYKMYEAAWRPTMRHSKLKSHMII